MELVFIPLSLVGRIVLAVVKSAFSIHFVLLKLALVVGAVFEDKLAFAVFALVKSSAFVSSTVFISLDHINQMLFVLLHSQFSRHRLRVPLLASLVFLLTRLRSRRQRSELWDSAIGGRAVRV